MTTSKNTTMTTVTTEQAIQDGNSNANQSIKGKFIGREVYCNVGSMVEYIISAGMEDRNAPFTMDDVENYYSYPEYYGKHASFAGGTEEERDEEVERLNEMRQDKQSLLDELYDIEETTPEQDAEIQGLETEIMAIESERDELSELETEAQEVYEWWAVSDYLYDELKGKGYPVVDAGSCYVWGRCTTGQAILLDSVITHICAEMGILDGQANAWTV